MMITLNIYLRQLRLSPILQIKKKTVDHFNREGGGNRFH